MPEVRVPMNLELTVAWAWARGLLQPEPGFRSDVLRAKNYSWAIGSKDGFAGWIVNPIMSTTVL